jgi:cyclopropane-fatty-acyl-phospholipid synthase
MSDVDDNANSIGSPRARCLRPDGLFLLHPIGAHYDPALMAGHRNVERVWDRLSDRYDERFRRMWTYYLLMSAGNFRARANRVRQIVFSHDGIRDSYTSIR